MMNQGKVAVVTGGASGIGEAVVRRLCEDGYSVAINYNSSEAKAEALASELSLSGYTVGIYKADVSDSTEANEMIKKINNEMGEPCLLVNNSGIAQQKLFTDITDEDWSRMIDKDTPVPTPDTKKYENAVGVFEGGGYNEKGIYRPSKKCLMNSFYGVEEFCPVCKHSLEKMIITLTNKQ